MGEKRDWKKRPGYAKNLADCNLRVTPQRAAIYEELIKAEDHPSAETVYLRVREKFPNISFDTVYRTLLSFAEKGLLGTVEGYSRKRRFDPNLNAHHHLRCIRCGHITDFTNAAYDALEIPSELEKEFRIIHKKVVLEGICGKCHKERKD